MLTFPPVTQNLCVLFGNLYFWTNLLTGEIFYTFSEWNQNYCINIKVRKKKKKPIQLCIYMFSIIKMIKINEHNDFFDFVNIALSKEKSFSSLRPQVFYCFIFFFSASDMQPQIPPLWHWETNKKANNLHQDTGGKIKICHPLNVSNGFPGCR